MHAGKLDRDTAAGRLYRILKAHPGEWMGGWELSQAAVTDCLSTRISEVRRQLPAHETIDHMERRIDGKRRQFYRLRKFSESPPPGLFNTSGKCGMHEANHFYPLDGAVSEGQAMAVYHAKYGGWPVWSKVIRQDPATGRWWVMMSVDSSG